MAPKHAYNPIKTTEPEGTPVLDKNKKILYYGETCEMRNCNNCNEMIGYRQEDCEQKQQELQNNNPFKKLYNNIKKNINNMF